MGVFRLLKLQISNSLIFWVIAGDLIFFLSFFVDLILDLALNIPSCFGGDLILGSASCFGVDLILDLALSLPYFSGVNLILEWRCESLLFYIPCIRKYIDYYCCDYNCFNKILFFVHVLCNISCYEIKTYLIFRIKFVLHVLAKFFLLETQGISSICMF